MNKYRKMIYNKSKSRSHYYVVYYEYTDEYSNEKITYYHSITNYKNINHEKAARFESIDEAQKVRDRLVRKTGILEWKILSISKTTEITFTKHIPIVELR